MKENSSSGNLKDVCSEDRGVPVSPSSDIEISLIREQFPEHNLIVAACPGKSSYQVEPVSFLQLQVSMLLGGYKDHLIEVSKLIRME